MRTMVKFRSFWASDVGESRIKQFALESGIQPIGNETKYGYALISILDSEHYYRILKAAAKCGIELEESFRAEHCEDEDFQDPMSPQYCRMIVKHDVECETGCVLSLVRPCPMGESPSQCGLSKIVENPYPVDSREILYSLCTDLHSQIITTKAIVYIINSSGLQGLDAYPTKDLASGAETYFRIEPRNILPPLSSKTDVYYERPPCPHCSNKNLFYRGMLTYTRDALTDIPDFNLTNESFGYGLLFPDWIVHWRVRDLLRNKLGLPDSLVTWHPIAIES